MHLEGTPEWIKVLGNVSCGGVVGHVKMGEIMKDTMDKYISLELLTEATLLEKDVNGGECMRCGKQYKRVDVKTAYIEFHYFEPACSCYPLCPWCGRPLHHETETGMKHCSNCPSAQCPEWTTKTEWDNNEKRKVEKKHRSNGLMEMCGKVWRCSECGSMKGTSEIGRRK